MRRFENELLERENLLGSTFGNLTIQDQELTKRTYTRYFLENSEKSNRWTSYKWANNQKKILSQISGEQNVNKILGILDNNIKRSNKLTQIIVEVLLLEKTIKTSSG